MKKTFNNFFIPYLMFSAEGYIKKIHVLYVAEKQSKETYTKRNVFF